MMIACETYITNVSHELIARFFLDNEKSKDAMLSVMNLSLLQLTSLFSTSIKDLQKQIEEVKDWDQLRKDNEVFNQK